MQDLRPTTELRFTEQRTDVVQAERAAAQQAPQPLDAALLQLVGGGVTRTDLPGTGW